MTPAFTDGGRNRSSLLLLAALFAIATYAILSLRAELAPGLNAEFVSPRRLVGTVAGAVLFWVILRRLDRSPPARWGGSMQLLGMLAIAAAGLLAVRAGFGWLIRTEDVPLAQDVRWTITWLGYLGLSTGLYIAHRLRSESSALAPPASTAVATPDVADTIDWLVEATLAEYDAGRPADRRELAARLLARAGYRVADPLAATHNRRIAMVERVAARLAA